MYCNVIVMDIENKSVVALLALLKSLIFVCVHFYPKESDCSEFGCPSHRKGPCGPL